MFRKIISSLIIFLFCFNITYSKNIIPYTTIPHLDTAISYYNRGVKEKTNNNDGKEDTIKKNRHQPIRSQ